MNDVCTYLIHLHGHLDEDEINALSPLRVTVDRCDAGDTLLTAHTDQAGLIGLLRHLHGLGYILVSLNRLENV